MVMYKKLSKILITTLIIITGCATGKVGYNVVNKEQIEIKPETETNITAEINIASKTKVPSAEKLQEEEVVEVEKISQAPEHENNQEQAKLYIVKSGDTLWDISQSLLGNALQYRVIAEKNNLANPDLIYPGQKLHLENLPKPKEAVSKTRVMAVSKSSIKSQSKVTKIIEKQVELPDFPIRPNRAFTEGEELVFSVEYFGIAAGYATLKVLTGPKIHNRPTWHLVATARTHPAFEWMFKVRDKIESYFDAQSLFSWRYEKHLREGKYSKDSKIIYDQYNQQVIKGENKEVLPALPLAQDVLSEFYFFRTLKFKLGEEIKIPVVADNGKSYDLRVKILREERAKVPAGTFDCWVVEPYLNFEGLFKHKGKLYIWVTKDEHKVPVLIKSKIVIGSIDIILRKAIVIGKEKNKK